MPENLLPIITLTQTPPSFFLLFLWICHWGIWSETSVYRWSDFGWYFADIVVYPHCAFNELQKQDEMKESNYTNFQMRVLTKNQTTKYQQRNLFFQIPKQKQVLWTSIPKDMTGIIYTLNPTFFCIHFSIVHARSSSGDVTQ